MKRDFLRVNAIPLIMDGNLQGRIIRGKCDAYFCVEIEFVAMLNGIDTSLS